MATTKKNSSSNKKTNRVVNTKPIEILKPADALKPAGSLKPVQGGNRIEPILSIINSAGLKNKQFLTCVDSDDIMTLTFTENIKGMTKNEILQWLQDKAERMRGAEIIERIKAERAASEFGRIVSSVCSDRCGFKVEINPAGGVTCMYSSGVGQTLEFGLEIEHFSYKLERRTDVSKITLTSKEKQKNNNSIQLAKWVTIASANSAWGFVSVNDPSVTEGVRYTYRMTVTNLKTKKTTEYEESIQYKRLDIVIKSFTAVPDVKDKKISLYFDVENAVSESIKVFRVKPTPKKEIVKPYVDRDVEHNKTYEYLLSATNFWNPDPIEKRVAVTCSNLTPSVGKLSFEIEKLEKGVTLKWTPDSKASSYAVERKLTNASSWTVIYDNQSYKRNVQTNEYLYTDIDSALKINTSYDYRVRCRNGWGDGYSKIVTVKMFNNAPKMPRMLPHSKAWNDKIRLEWVRNDDAKTYVISRKEGGKTLTWETNSSANSFIDEQSQSGILYSYDIVAKNGWGCSDARSYDAIVDKKEYKGSLDNCFKYVDDTIDELEKNWTSDFQGITTDGAYWYFTNGSGFARLSKFPVDESLNRSSPTNGTKKKYGAIEYTISSSGRSKSFYTKYSKHFGDLCYYKKYLFVPAYDGDLSNAEIWIIDSATLDIKHRETLKNSNGDCFESLGWCAINPNDDRLYTSNSTLSGYLFTFKIELGNIGTSKNVFSFVKTTPLYDENGNVFPEKGCMQGGCFDYFDNLYLNSGFHDPDRRPGEGIHVFKMIRDETKMLNNVMASKTSNVQKADAYEAYLSENLSVPVEYSKGVLFAKSVLKKTNTNEFVYEITHGTTVWYLDNWSWKKTGTIAEEAQGLVYYDFANTAGSVSPYYDDMKSSSLHVSLLDNDSSDDDVYIKTYRHKFRDTEEKNLYYDPSNIKVSGYDILDNKILVKRFKNQTAAKNALNVLKNFKKIHTIGRIYTSSENHNYEFSAIESSSVMSKTGCTTISYTGSKVSSPVQEQERWVVKLNPSASKVYRFYAHNQADAKRIYDIVKKYNKVCIIGVGADSDGRIRSTNNLIWLEK